MLFSKAIENHGWTNGQDKLFRSCVICNISKGRIEKKNNDK